MMNAITPEYLFRYGTMYQRRRRLIEGNAFLALQTSTNGTSYYPQHMQNYTQMASGRLTPQYTANRSNRVRKVWFSTIIMKSNSSDGDNRIVFSPTLRGNRFKNFRKGIRGWWIFVMLKGAVWLFRIPKSDYNVPDHGLKTTDSTGTTVPKWHRIQPPDMGELLISFSSLFLDELSIWSNLKAPVVKSMQHLIEVLEPMDTLVSSYLKYQLYPWIVWYLHRTPIESSESRIVSDLFFEFSVKRSILLISVIFKVNSSFYKNRCIPVQSQRCVFIDPS